MEDRQLPVQHQIITLIVIFWFLSISASSFWFFMDKISARKNQDLAKQVETAFKQTTTNYDRQLAAMQQVIQETRAMQTAPAKK